MRLYKNQRIYGTGKDNRCFVIDDVSKGWVVYHTAGNPDCYGFSCPASWIMTRSDGRPGIFKSAPQRRQKASNAGYSALQWVVASWRQSRMPADA